MPDQDKDSKTEEPTSKKIQDSWKEGQFAKSPEFGSAAVLASIALVFAFLGREQVFIFLRFCESILAHLGEYEFSQTAITDNFREGAFALGRVVAPILIGCSIASILAGGLQSRFRLTPKLLEAKLSKLNPIKGCKKIFGVNSIVQFGIDLAKFIVVGVIIYGALDDIMSDPVFTSVVSIWHLGEFIADTSLALLLRLTLAVGVIAIINYLYQIRKTRKDLRMTKQEVKEERKQQEGDPRVRAAMRGRARGMLQRKMLKNVETADVVVTNPTHFAIALKYERGKDAAPVVVAKGENLFAQRIKEIARQHDVPTVENKPLARMLFKVGQVGQAIPADLYEVVASILAHVYRTHRYYFHRLGARRAEAGTAVDPSTVDA